MTLQILRQTETPKRLSKRKLTDRLVKLIFNGQTDMTANAQTLGIGRATAYRYWNAWVESEEAQQLDVEWWAFFQQLKDKSPIKAFEGLTRIKIRKTPQKLEMKKEVKIDEKHVSIVADYTDALSAAAQRDLSAFRAKQQVDTEESPSTTA